MTTGSISGSGVNAPGIGKVALQAARAPAPANTPDEASIVRADKKGRIVKVSPVAPPKAFNAGSVFERSSSLLRPTLDGEVKMAFARPDIKGKEIEIASAFYVRQ
jgi:hypothetical protein